MSRALRAAGFGALLCVAGGAFDLPALYVPGVAIVLVAAVAVVWVTLAAHGAALLRDAAPATIQEGEPYPLRLRLVRGLLPPPAGELIEPVLGAALPATDPRSRRVRVNVRFSRRGRRTLAPARLVIRDPLSLVQRETVSGSTDLLVLPRIEPLIVNAAAGSTGMEAVAGSLTEAAAELELDSLRPYRTGTPASRIHWPAVARTRTMMERRLVAESDSRPLVALDPRDPPSAEALDAAVRAAASLAVHLARRPGGCSLLLPGQRRPTDLDSGLRGWPALHARLALLEASAGAPASRRLERSGPMFWVSASGRTVPPLVKRGGVGSWIVTPAAVAGRKPSFTVAGCAGYGLVAQRGRSAA